MTHATHATARWTRRDEYPCIIYISIVVVVVASSSSHRRRAHIRMHHRARHPRVHPCIHPSIHPSTHPPRDATLPATSRRCKQKNHTRENTTRTPRTWIFVALKAATRETKEDARRADIVCVCVRECRDARRDRGGGGGRRHDDSDIRRRHESDIRRMHGDAPAGRLPRPWSSSSSVDGTPRAVWS